MRYLRNLSLFFPLHAVRLFSESGAEQNLESLIKTLTEMERETADEALEEAAVVPEEAEETAALPPTLDPDTARGLTRMLNYLEELALTLPETEMRDKLTERVEKVIKDIQEVSIDDGGETLWPMT
jgi:hypothetical protein